MIFVNVSTISILFIQKKQAIKLAKKLKN